MTGAAEILSELHKSGVTVMVDGDILILKPKRLLNEDLLARVRDLKPHIIRALANGPATCAASCYQIERGRTIHHPWAGCNTVVAQLVEPIVPTRPDCGCNGPVCRQCWLCPEHCQCLPKGLCWHCRGEGCCECTACRKRYAGDVARCVVCQGAGKLAGRLQ
jgi:hypothetical protein